MSNYERINREFRAQSDDGKVHSVIEFQNMIDTSTKEGRSEMPGLKRLALADGRSVQYIEPKTFKIVDIDQIIREIG